MAISDIITELNAHFIDAFDPEVEVQLIHDNAPNQDLDESLPMVRIFFAPDVTAFTTMGGAARQVKGLIVIQINTPKQTGWAGGLQLVDEVTSVFLNYRSNNVFCDDAQFNREELDLWLQHNVMIPFTAMLSA